MGSALSHNFYHSNPKTHLVFNESGFWAPGIQIPLYLKNGTFQKFERNTINVVKYIINNIKAKGVKQQIT